VNVLHYTLVFCATMVCPAEWRWSRQCSVQHSLFFYQQDLSLIPSVRCFARMTSLLEVQMLLSKVYRLFDPLTPTVAMCMGTDMKHPMPDRVKTLFVIFDIRSLWCSASSSSRFKDMFDRMPKFVGVTWPRPRPLSGKIICALARHSRNKAARQIWSL